MSTGGYPKSTTKSSAKPTPIKKSSSAGSAASKKPAAPASPIQPPVVYYGGENKTYSGGAQFVFFVLLLLFIFMSWKEVGSQLLKIIWDKNYGKGIDQINWGKYAGIAVFIIAATLIADVNDELASIMVLMTIGIAAVYVVENKGGGFTDFLNLLTKKSKG